MLTGINVAGSDCRRSSSGQCRLRFTARSRGVLGLSGRGYWTFVPYLRDTCGSYSYAAISKIGGEKARCETPHTAGDVCVQRLVKNDDPNVVNITIVPKQIRAEFHFVNADCETKVRNGSRQQDPRYCETGVDMSDQDYQGYIKYGIISRPEVQM